MYPAQFEYHKASTVKEALDLLGKYKDEAKLLAGGHSLLPAMKLRLAQPKHLIDIGKVAGLSGVKEEGGTLVIPAHGRVGDEADVLEYRDMVTIVRDRIKDMVQRGSTLAQVKAARPTLDYDRQYGADAGAWTTSQFVEAIYTDLSARSGRGGRK